MAKTIFDNMFDLVDEEELQGPEFAPQPSPEPVAAQPPLEQVTDMDVAPLGPEDTPSPEPAPAENIFDKMFPNLVSSDQIQQDELFSQDGAPQLDTSLDDQDTMLDKALDFAPYASLAFLPFLRGMARRIFKKPGATVREADEILALEAPAERAALTGPTERLALEGPKGMIFGEGFTAKPVQKLIKNPVILGSQPAKAPIKSAGKIQVPRDLPKPGPGVILPNGRTMGQLEVEQALNKSPALMTAEEKVLVNAIKNKKILMPAMAAAGTGSVLLAGSAGEAQAGELPPQEERTNMGSMVDLDTVMMKTEDLEYTPLNLVNPISAITKLTGPVLEQLNVALQNYGDQQRRYMSLTFKQANGELLTEDDQSFMYDFLTNHALMFAGTGGATKKSPFVERLLKKGKEKIALIKDQISGGKKHIEAIKRQVIPRYKQTEEYIALDLDRAGKIALDRLDVQNAVRPIAAMSAKERVMAGKALTGVTEGVPQKVLDAVKPVRKQIDRLSTELSKELDKPGQEALREIINNNVGRYVRRVYARDVLGSKYVPHEDAVTGARTYLKENLRVRDPITRKARPATEIEIENAIKNIVAGRQTSFAIGSNLKRIEIGPLKHRKDIPKPIRSLMGEIQEGAYAGARTVADLSQTLHNIRFFKILADNESMVSKVAREGFTTKPVPFNPRYGKLQGKFVKQEIWDDLTNMVERDLNQFEEVYFAWLNGFKFAKTALNPATHMRNMMGNVIFADLAKINPANLKNWTYYGRAAREIVHEGPLFREAIRHGGLGTEVIGSEIQPILKSFLANENRGSIVQAISNTAAKHSEAIGWVYNAEDQLFKLASFIKQRQLGMTSQEAARHVNKWFPNYRDVAPVIKKLRGTTVGSLIANPFVSFTAEATRIYGTAIKEGNMRLATWMIGFPAAMTAFGAHMQGLDFDDVKTVAKSLPENQQFKYQVPLPWRDRDGALQVLDLSYIIPLGDAAQARGLSNLPFWSQFVGGNPIALATAQLAANKNFYSRGEIVKPSDLHPSLKRAEFFASQTLPIPTFIPQLARLQERIGLAEFGGKEKTVAKGLSNIFTALRTTPLDQQFVSRVVQLRKELSDIKAERRQISAKLNNNQIKKKDADKKLKNLDIRLDKLRDEKELLDKSQRLIGGRALTP